MFVRSAAAPKQRQVRLKEAQDQQRKEDTELAASYFDKFDVNNSGVLEEHQLGALLHDITGSVTTPEALAHVQKDLQCKSGSGSEGVPKELVLESVTKYIAFMKKQVTLDTLFDKYDTDKSGKIEKDELKVIMTEISSNNGRSPPSDEDVDFILENSDGRFGGEAGDEALDRKEIMPAIALWEALIQQQGGILAKFENVVLKSKACVVS